MAYFRDPDFDPYYNQDYDEDCDMSLEERLSVLHSISIDILEKKIHEFDESYTDAFFRDLTDLIYDCLEQEELLFYREAIKLFFKGTSYPIAIYFIENNPRIRENFLRLAEEGIDIIDTEIIKVKNKEKDMWNNTRKLMTDFLNKFE